VFGESISQGWRAHHSHEVGEKARNLRRVSASFGRKAAYHALRDSEGHGRQACLQLRRSWEEKRPPRGGPGRPHTGVGSRRQGFLGCFGTFGESYPAWGGEEVFRDLGGPLGRGSCAFGRSGASSSPSGLGGSRLRGVVGEDSRGEETQESIGRWGGATRVSSERIREGRNASKQVKLAESGGFIARAQDVREAGLRVGGKGAHS